jgi:hypothetical protein
MGNRARATIKVKVEILDIDQRLFPEMSSTVFFLPEAGADAKADPSQTNAKRIFTRTAAIAKDAEESYVWVVGDKMRVTRVAVVTGSEQDGRTEITQGLAGGERVVLDPPADMRADQLVKISD